MSKTEVYANGLEIACKASDGKSTASFPDPCYSPPSPRSGWKVVPYANTAKASDTANGSKTVFIKGKPVMLKDKSYFSTSTGNEGAAGPLGVATGVKKGKAYFTNWSLNVKIEGYNVCRHTDMMTHNHGSEPGNTGTWNFLSNSSENEVKKCKEAIEKADKECAVSKSEQKKFIKAQNKRNKKRSKHKKKPFKVRPKTWKDENCKGLLFYPDLHNLEKRLRDLEKDAKDLYHDLAGEAWSAMGNKALEKGKDYAVRTGVKHGTGFVATWWTGPVALATQIAIAVTDVLDAVVSIISLPFQLYGAYSNVADVRNMLEKIPETLDKLQATKEATGDSINPAIIYFA